MNHSELMKFQPGDKVTYDPKDTEDWMSLESAIHASQFGVFVSKGRELIIAEVYGVSKKGKIRFNHFPKGKIWQSKEKENSSTQIELEFEEAHDIVKATDFKRKNLEEFSSYLFNDIIKYESNVFSPREYLLEMVDKSCHYNVYNLPIEKYFWYLDWELQDTTKSSIDDFEEQLEQRIEESWDYDIEPEFDYAQELKIFLNDINQRRNFFQGTRNVCEVLATKYKIATYGELIRAFTQNRIKLTDINWFFTNGWLAKKEFQYAINEGYEHAYPSEKFEEYQW